MKRLAIIAIILISLVGITVYLNQHNGGSKLPVAISGTTMGTSYHLKLIATDGWKVNAETLKRLITIRLAEIDNKMSTYKDNSDVSRLNKATAGKWISIDAETLVVVSAAQKISEISMGSFDVTIGKLVNLWGFGPTINLNAIPAATEISTLLEHAGYNKLELQLDPPALLKQCKSLYLDLSAIAKGYAVDAVAKLLRENGIDNFLVEIGGEIVTQGEKGVGDPWVIGIETPKAGQRVVHKRLNLRNVAMATSGDYRNYFEENGVRYSHTIDPANGYPIKHKLASVTVIDESCMRADAVATAIMVMGVKKGLKFAETQNLAIFMLIKDGAGFAEKQSSAFNTYLGD